MEITAIRAERGRLWSMETRNCQKLLRYLLPPIGQYTQRLDNIACAGQLGALSMLRISSPTISYCSPWFTPTPRPCSRPIPTSSLVTLFLRCCSDNVDGGPQCVFSRDSIAASAFGHSTQTLALYLDMAYFVTSFRHQARTIESTLAYRSRQPHRYLTPGKCSLHTLLNVPQAANRFAVSCKKLFWKPGERGHRDARALPPIMEVNLESRIIAVITNTTSMGAMPRRSVHIKVGWD